MVCNKCGYQLGKDALFCQRCGNRINSGEAESFSKGEDLNKIDIKSKKDSGGKVYTNIILILTVAIIAVVAVAVACLIISNNMKSTLEADGRQGTISSKRPTKVNENKKYIKESEVIESEIEETEIKKHGEEPVVGNFGNTEPEEEFDFRYGVTDIIENPEYKMISNSKYEYYCHVPSHFVADHDLDRVRYYSPDHTAVMEIVSYINTENKTAKEALNERIAALGGEVSYSASGETWFAVAIRKNGNSYYTKGFVDKYVREFIFDFPTEYEIYREYVEYMEDNFKRTDK